MFALTSIACSLALHAAVSANPVGASRRLDLIGTSEWPVAEKSGKVVVGYVQDDPDSASLADKLDYEKLTHLNIAFANPTDASGTLNVTPNTAALVAQAHQHGVKVLISIGGGDASEDKALQSRYFDLIGAAKRDSFVAKLMNYVASNQLDGLDVDLEGPAINQDYEAFVKALSKALHAKSKLMTAAVSSGYGGDQITKNALDCFDIVNMMAYDETGPWAPDKPGQHSSMDLAKQNTTYWTGRGVAKNKLTLGLPFYGYGFGSSFTKGGYTYIDIVTQYPGAEELDQVGKTIYYNGIPTIKAKTQFVLDQGLAGVMIWSLNQDAPGEKSLLAAIETTLAAASH